MQNRFLAIPVFNFQEHVTNKHLVCYEFYNNRLKFH